jgi:hypothetical protein
LAPEVVGDVDHPGDLGHRVENRDFDSLASMRNRAHRLAVMLDAFRPLELSDDALEIGDPEYRFAWRS